MEIAEYVSLLKRDGAQFRVAGGELTLTLVECGSLAFPTGAIVFTDPLVETGPDDDSMVFAHIPSGEYPIRISAVVIPPSEVVPRGATRGAGVFVEVSSRDVVEWRPARDSPKGPMAFGVDYGWGGLFDVSAQAQMDEWLGDQDRVDRLFEAGPLFHRVPGDPGGLIFDCAMGGGAYPVWLGLDEHGEVASIVVDLEILWHGVPV